MNNTDASPFLTQLAKLLPPDAVLTDIDDCRAYASDWTRTPGRALCVVLPRTTEEVVRVLRQCQQSKVPVVPSGGRTGLAGGAVASSQQLVLNLSRMNRLGPVDNSGLTVRVQAGATTQAVHEHCAEEGLTWPIDLAAKGTSQIGGNLSTNAGGVRVIRWGMARKWVVGLQAVTMQGEVLELNNGLEKNNTGYDLVQLLIGSEGTLAVITEATLKLARLPSPNNVAVLLFPFEDLASIVVLFERARRGPFAINAFEFFSEKCLRAVETKFKRQSKLSSRGNYYALMEIEHASGEMGRAEAEQWLSSVLEDGIVSDGLMAQSSEEKKSVWGLREGITESLQMMALVRKYDVSVAVKFLIPFLDEVQNALKADTFKFDLYLFGHLGDGSPHLNLLQPENISKEEYVRDCERFEQTLFLLLKKYGGSISAEHGVGSLKRHWLSHSRTPAELRLLRAIKQSFDPENLLNPGKVLPDLE